MNAARKAGRAILNGAHKNGHATSAAPAGISPQVPAPALAGDDESLTQSLLLRSITASATNPRKHFDEAALEDLARSIREHGVLQPVIVRPAQGGRFELVAGERRWLAAAIAGLSVIPAIVRKLSDVQVREIQLVENVQREDISPLEEAESLHELTKLGHKPEDLAQRTGQGIGAIRRKLKLLKLPEKGREALIAGKISPGVAEAIARVPGKAQAEALKFATSARYYGSDLLPSLREVERHIREHCHRQLKKAPFSRMSLDLVPAAGSCDECPKRAGNLAKAEPEAYKGIRADVCTDPDCFTAKMDAHRKRAIEIARGLGYQILSDGQCLNLFRYNDRLIGNTGYVDLDETCFEAKKPRKYRQLLEPHLESKQIHFAHDRAGAEHYLVDATLAGQLLKQHHGIGKAAAGRRISSASDARDEARRRFESKVEAETSRKLLKAIAAAGKPIGENLYNPLTTKDETAVAAILRFLARKAGNSWSGTRDEVHRLYGCKGTVEQRNKGLDKFIDAAPIGELLALLLQLELGDALVREWGNPSFGDVAKALALPDRSDVRKGVEREFKCQAKAKAK